MKTRGRYIAFGSLCLLAIGAIAVPGASATTGTTAFTCAKKATEGGAGFSKEHCKPSDAVATGAKFEHKAIPENTTTEVRVTNAKTGTGTETATVAKLRSVRAGVELELQATGVEDIAEMQNKIVGGEPVISGTGVTTYSGVTVTKPAGKGCTVEGGKIVTKLLAGTSAGQGMEGKLTPATGTTFATFTISGCSVSALNGTYEVTGSIKCPGEGATVLCTHTATTAQNTLLLGGQKAGIEVATTFSGRANSTQAFTPLAVTTVEH
jgi:hypothetical protein